MKTWFIAPLLALTACVSSPDGEVHFDRERAHRELSALIVDARNFADLVDDEETAATANQVAGALSIVDDALITGQAGDDLLLSINVALGLIPEVSEVFDEDEDHQRELRLIVFAVRTVLNHAQALLAT